MLRLELQRRQGLDRLRGRLDLRRRRLAAACYNQVGVLQHKQHMSHTQNKEVVGTGHWYLRGRPTQAIYVWGRLGIYSKVLEGC
ncbi:hypothetical protein GDO81_010905 [Engystomops pustulosus]|uniref:Uncharacterized protein n=1 Tax=Engystomops pustulosus TaxID=76066 RepID=A0AAV7C3J5_ENGPU|nr:hypothetical protein GDO81_010905 [Engystomops pustulosus]